jgi:hypothetical protein
MVRRGVGRVGRIPDNMSIDGTARVGGMSRVRLGGVGGVLRCLIRVRGPARRVGVRVRA